MALNKEYQRDFNQKTIFGAAIDPETEEEIKYEDPFYNCLINSNYAQL